MHVRNKAIAALDFYGLNPYQPTAILPHEWQDIALGLAESLREIAEMTQAQSVIIAQAQSTIRHEFPTVSDMVSDGFPPSDYSGHDPMDYGIEPDYGRNQDFFDLLISLVRSM